MTDTLLAQGFARTGAVVMVRRPFDVVDGWAARTSSEGHL
jgi:hypothetical protein